MKKTVKNKSSKKTVKKSVKKLSKKKASHSIEEDIVIENKISKEINELEKEAHKDEQETKEMEEEVKKLDEDVAHELNISKKEIDNLDIQKKPFNKKIIIGILLTLLLAIIFSFNYFREDMTDYNGFTFQKNANGYWEVVLEQGPMPFYYHPSEVDDLPVDLKAVQDITNLVLNKGSLVVSMNPSLEPGTGKNVGFAYIEISKVTAQLFAIPTTSASQYEIEGYDWPIVRCKDAKGTNVVIMMELAEQSEITNENYCISLSAETEEDYVRLADALSYRILGIISN